MKKLLILATCFLLLAGVSNAQRYAVIDSKYILDKLPELPEMINRANKAMELLSSYEFMKNKNQSNEYEIKEKSSKLKKTYLIIGLLIIVIILLIVFK